MNYIILNENKVLGCYDKKVIAISSFLDILIYKCGICNELSKLKKINNCKLISILKNSSMTKGIYKFNLETFNFKNLISDENILDKVERLNFSYKFSELKKMLFVSEEQSESEITISETEDPLSSEIEESYSNDESSKIAKTIDFDQLKRKIDKLKKIKSNKLEQFNIKRVEKLNAEREIKLKKEKINEYKRRFEADKEIYSKIKNSVDNNECIPDLFKDQYPIFETLQNLNIINTDNAFAFYHKKMQEIDAEKALNNNYSNMFNDSALFYTNRNNICSDSSSDEEEKDNMSKIAEELIDSEISDSVNILNSDSKL